jgi:hypothetical protein
MDDNEHSPLLMAMMQRMAMQKPQQQAGGALGGLSGLLNNPMVLAAMKKYMGGQGTPGYTGTGAAPNLTSTLPDPMQPFANMQPFPYRP